MILLATHAVDGGKEIQERFLKSFFTKSLGPDGAMPRGGPGAVPRPQIRELPYKNYAKSRKGTGAQSLGDLMRAMYCADSAHVHGRAAAILQLYNAKSKRFETDGTTDADDVALATDSLLLLTHLCIMCFATVGGNWYGIEYRDQILDYADAFSRITRSAAP